MISIQATSEQQFSPVQLELPSRRFRTHVRESAKPRELRRKQRWGSAAGWLEDAFSVILLCGLTVAMLGATGIFARMIFNEMARYSSYDLLMMLGG